MEPNAFAFSSVLWRYSGHTAWYFVTLPREVADRIRPQASKRGFGSVRVSVTVGGTTWKTSIFPDKSSGSYLLPVKAAIRHKEALAEGAEIDVFLEL